MEKEKNKKLLWITSNGGVIGFLILYFSGGGQKLSELGWDFWVKIGWMEPYATGERYPPGHNLNWVWIVLLFVLINVLTIIANKISQKSTGK